MAGGGRAADQAAKTKAAGAKLLLVNPPWLRLRGSIWRQVSGITPPTGIAILAAVMEGKGVATEIIDAQAMGLDEERLVGEIVGRRPEWLGMTATTPIVKGAYRIADAVKRALPETRIVMGGSHVSALPEEPLRESSVDYVLKGEAEETLPLLVGGSAPENIPGLHRRGAGGEILSNPPPALIEDLDALPMPAFDKLPIDKYRPSLGNYRRLPCLGVTMSRGCYGRCTFCYREMFGSRVRTPSAERIIEILRILQARYHVREVQYYDDIFLGTKPRIHAFCEALGAAGLRMDWVCNLRAELTDAETVRAMRRAGCYMVDFGIESGDAAVLESMRKNVELEKTLEAMRTARAGGMRLKSGFMLGYPGETRASMQRTIATSRRADPDTAMFNIVTPFPGTEIFEQCGREGTLLTRDWDRYDYAYPLIGLPDATPDELLKIYKRAYRKFYMRPRVVWRWLRLVRTKEQFKMAVSAFFAILSLITVERRRFAAQ